jgi:hypothetical protein
MANKKRKAKSLPKKVCRRTMKSRLREKKVSKFMHYK